MNKRIVYGIIVAALALVVVGCGYQAAPTPAMEPYDVAVERELIVAESGFMGDEEAYAPAAPGSGAGNYSAIERLIVRNASLSLVVSDTEQALGEIKDLVILVGPQAEHPEDLEETPLIMGICLQHLKDEGRYVVGCPPNNDKMVEAIRELTGI